MGSRCSYHGFLGVADDPRADAFGRVGVVPLKNLKNHEGISLA